ncbi:MAG: mandelate racemase/muconate lactonizing enzyme family protein [Chloroflexota bacterium]|nr:mandelate racemase/muconate lactonizing enzyme family protein [Chloroflexota bacterium]
MRISDLEAFSVGIPFRAPIFSAYGVSYPARLRTFIRLHTDEGVTGVGEAGVAATHHVAYGEQLRLFQEVVKPLILGQDPCDYLALMQRLRYIPEAIAVELACWDIIGKVAGLPLYRLLGGRGPCERVPVAGYFFFRAAGQGGEPAVNLDNCVEHARRLVETYGFGTLKMKIGVFEPELEAEAIAQVRAALGPRLKLRVDPNGCWSLPTAKRMLQRLAPLDLEYVEEPIKFVPARVPYTTQTGVPSLDTLGLAHLRQTAQTPIAADGCYRIDLLWQIARDQAADIVLGDIQGSMGVRGLHDFFTVAEALGLAAGLHSGTELGVQQAAKLHIAAARPELAVAGDAIYHEYVDDVLRGGKFVYEQGTMRVPQGPGLGVELDEEKLAAYELTEERHRAFDCYWQELRRGYGIPPAGHDLLVRHL